MRVFLPFDTDSGNFCCGVRALCDVFVLFIKLCCHCWIVKFFPIIFGLEFAAVLFVAENYAQS